MVLEITQYPTEFRDFAPSTSNGPETLESAANDQLDVEDERQDLMRHGWEAGYSSDFENLAAAEAESGAFFAGSNVTLFASAEGAQGYWDDSERETPLLKGRTFDGFTVAELTLAGLALADEGMQLEFTITYPHEDGSEGAFWCGGSVFRHGWLLGAVNLCGYGLREIEKDNLAARAAELAGKLNERVASTLGALS